MGVSVVVGLQFGDEGKGATTDRLTSVSGTDEDKIVCRFQGGHNAGHGIIFPEDDEKTIFRIIPAGILNEGALCCLTGGTVVYPEAIVEELVKLAEKGVDFKDRFLISKRAPLVMPWHIGLDEAREKGDGSIGTTKNGIGPAYEQFVSRQSVLAEDLLSREGREHARDKIRRSYGEILSVFSDLGVDGLSVDIPSSVDGALQEFNRRFDDTYKNILPFIGDVESVLQHGIDTDADIIMEGAQGTMLSVGSGTYPYVTSSHTTSGGVCVGAGIAPRDIGQVVGVCKAYMTRVGEGPHSTELDNSTPEAEHLYTVGKEWDYADRPHRCGWLDLDLVRRAIRVNGCSEIALTKLDVLSGLDTVKIKMNGKLIEFDGWYDDISDVEDVCNLPEEALRYIGFIEDAISPLNCDIGSISVGPKRDQWFAYMSE